MLILITITNLLLLLLSQLSHAVIYCTFSTYYSTRALFKALTVPLSLTHHKVTRSNFWFGLSS